MEREYTHDDCRLVLDVIFWKERSDIMDRLFFDERMQVEDIVSYLHVEDEDLMNVYKMIGICTALRAGRVSPEAFTGRMV